MSKGNEPAFGSAWTPTEEERRWGASGIHHLGRTKREYFAGLAMQGILSCGPDPVVDASWNEAVSVWAVTAADSLLAELEKTNDQ